MQIKHISPAITLSQDEIDTIVDAIAGPFTGADKTVGWTQDMKDAYNGLINAYNNGGSDRNNIDWVPRYSVSVALIMHRSIDGDENGFLYNRGVESKKENI